MSDHLIAIKSIKENQQNQVQACKEETYTSVNALGAQEDDGEETRLAPKKGTSVIKPMEEYDKSKVQPVVAQ